MFYREILFFQNSVPIILQVLVLCIESRVFNVPYACDMLNIYIFHFKHLESLVSEMQVLSPKQVSHLAKTG